METLPESKDCFFGMVERSVTIPLMTTPLMLSVGFWDTTVTLAGDPDKYTASKIITTLKWMMSAAAVEHGVLALTERIIIVDILRTYILSAVAQVRLIS